MAAARALSQGVKELRIHLCQKGETSRGVREFIENFYVPLKQQNPKLPILVRECSGVTPTLHARYGCLPCFKRGPCVFHKDPKSEILIGISGYEHPHYRLNKQCPLGVTLPLTLLAAAFKKPRSTQEPADSF